MMRTPSLNASRVGIRTLFAIVLSLSLGLPALAAAASPKWEPTVAVLYFDYGGNDNGPMAMLRKGLAQMLISDLSRVEGIRLVERAEIQAIIDELNLNESNKIDPKTANRIGKLVGAHYLVFGAYFDFMGTLRADARVVEVETSRVIQSVGSSGTPGEFLGVEQSLAKDLTTILQEDLQKRLAERAKEEKLDNKQYQARLRKEGKEQQRIQTQRQKRKRKREEKLKKARLAANQKKPAQPSSTNDTGSGATNNSTTNNSTTNNSTTDKSTTDKSTTDKSTTDKSTTDKSTTDNSTTDNSTTDNSTTDNSTADNSTTNNSTTNNSATNSGGSGTAMQGGAAPYYPPPAKLKTATALTYSQALDDIDNGRVEEARTKLQQVVGEQPDFKLAAVDLDNLMQ